MLTERSARVVAAVKLHRHIARRRAEQFLVEGPNLVEAATRRGSVREIFVTEAAAQRHRALLETPGIPVHLVTERAVKALSDTVILTGNSVDPYNGKCLRASAGSIFAIPVVVATDVDATLAALRTAGLQLLATALHGELCLDDAEPLLSRPTAWLFGPESQGLPEAVVAAADHRVRIPMSGGAESLNVAAAAAICLYQSARVHRGRRSRAHAAARYVGCFPCVASWVG